MQSMLDDTYYHQTTFLQLNTIRFLLSFPHPFTPSELSGFRRNQSIPMSQFSFEDILLITRCNSMQKVLDWPFCNFVAMHWATKFKVRWCTTKNKSRLSRWNWNKDAFCTLMEWRMKICVAAKSFAPPSSKIIELLQICFDISQYSHTAYWLLNKVVWI